MFIFNRGGGIGKKLAVDEGNGHFRLCWPFLATFITLNSFGHFWPPLGILGQITCDFGPFVETLHNVKLPSDIYSNFSIFGQFVAVFQGLLTLFHVIWALSAILLWLSFTIRGRFVPFVFFLAENKMNSHKHSHTYGSNPKRPSSDWRVVIGRWGVKAFLP